MWLIPAGFVLFFLNDWLDLRAKRAVSAFLFPLGLCLVLAGTVFACFTGAYAYPAALRIAAGIGAAVFLFLTFYSLFGAIPLKASYAEPGAKRPVCTVGVYALCRHPGVLWFLLLYICLHFALGMEPLAAAAASVLNVLLAVFEDRLVFPQLLTGYAEYQKTTPFLIPNAGSIRRCLKDHRKR